ncbi:DUF6461 domain-containing protein [Streptomyces iconiensis]|uniref:DUF6461 domain-containing protein n=1 Tax=Streptomyces iconiensis TaxID=1384038 RepID=A0ABT6ZVW4_9ACTN|nr:DUF6461 domain-containing protein [Streptomyces iconiensis]MDJ1133206.1 DUF6461 domain-containing protein [Streptomyces iconiensis]
MNSHSTAADYGWLEERYQPLMEAYCITLVQGLSPEALLKALGAEPVERITGVAELREPAEGDPWNMTESFVAIAPVGDWSLMVEYNGCVGIDGTMMLPISRGRVAVSHFLNINAVDYFSWYEDGAVRLTFAPLFPHHRDGSHPDELLTAMRESGFDLSGGEDASFDGHTEAAFALAERITGVHLTPELFDSAEFVCGRVPVPSRRPGPSPAG